MNKRLRAFHQLLKMTKRKVDEERLIIGEIMRKIEEYNTSLMSLEKELEYERMTSNGIEPYILSFTNFYQYTEIKKESIKGKIVSLERELQNNLDKMKEIFIEQKRYEYLLDSHYKKQKIKEEKIENAQIDEIGQVISETKRHLFYD